MTLERTCLLQQLSLLSVALVWNTEYQWESPNLLPNAIY